MIIHPFSDDLEMDGTGCVGLWLQGLIGDIILASTLFDEIRTRYPGRQWIIVHSYWNPARVEAVLELLKPFFADGRIRGYVYHHQPVCAPMPDDIAALFSKMGVDGVVQFMFDDMDRSRLGRPDLGFDLARPKRQKAILMRRSAWNPHFQERNRPYAEWQQIEAHVLAAGYETHVVGVDDEMDVSPGIVDRRHTMSLRELLEFTTDASLVVSCTTFLPVFTQFVCPSLVICDPRDYESQLKNWRVMDDYIVYAATSDYLPALLGAVAAPSVGTVA